MSFEFTQGQCVSHKSGGMVAIVTGSEVTAKGKEHYRVWVVPPEERRERWFLGDYLVATVVGGHDCIGCSMRRWCIP